MINITSYYNDKNIYILGDVFNQHESQIYRFPEVSSNIKKFSNKIKNYSELVKLDNFKGIYKYNFLEDIK